jgi:hypothetical protein
MKRYPNTAPDLIINQHPNCLAAQLPLVHSRGIFFYITLQIPRKKNTMNIFKAIIAASIVLASPAAAETWELGQSGNWHIKMSQNTNGGLLCGMMSFSRSRHVLNISVYEDGKYHLMVTNTESGVANRDPFWADVDFEITSPSMYEEWTILDAEIESRNHVTTVYHVIGMDPHQRDFIQDFMRGDYIALMKSGKSKEAHATWSLNGSAHAVTLLDTCRQRIMGER